MADKQVDHDLLVALVVKVDDLKVQVKEIKDDLVSRVIKLESRSNVDPDLLQWVTNFRANWKMLAAIGAGFLMLASSIVAAIISKYIWTHI